MSSIKPIKLYGQGGPNPAKVAMLLTELGLPYEVDPVPVTDTKNPAYVAINPNGRIPAIHDPNTDLTLWESGAIIEYLIERYDTQHMLSCPVGTNDAALAKQWLFFQVSGQGPYYGQAVWFMKYHKEQLPSAVERYVGEIKRVTGVLEAWLSKQDAGADGPWLVGGKYSFADLSFIMWQHLAMKMIPGFDADEYPAVKTWIEKMVARPAIKEVIEEAFKGH